MHVLNIIATVDLNSEIPYKIWFGKNVTYDHLRVFGCKIFVNVQNDESSKLDAKKKQIIFIGYYQDAFGYMVYGPQSKKIISSHGIVFMEVKTTKDINKIRTMLEK